MIFEFSPERGLEEDGEEKLKFEFSGSRFSILNRFRKKTEHKSSKLLF
jgi:hypothetical protein